MEHGLNASVAGGADLLLEVAHNEDERMLGLVAANFESSTLELKLNLGQRWVRKLCFGVFLMLVPSLSWQMHRFLYNTSQHSLSAGISNEQPRHVGV